MISAPRDKHLIYCNIILLFNNTNIIYLKKYIQLLEINCNLKNKLRKNENYGTRKVEKKSSVNILLLFRSR